MRFRRITSSGKYIPEADGLRFVAIASVVLYHLYGFLPDQGSGLPLHAAIEHGYRGVNLFYTISGFVLALPFASHYLRGSAHVSMKAYFIRRLTRLEPPYILSLLLFFAVAAVRRSPPDGLVQHFGASAVYLHNLIYGAQSSINAVAWTLEIEVQFYCLMPLLALVYAIPSHTLRRAGLIAGILLAGIVQVFYWDAPPALRLSICYAIQFFLGGILLADLYLLDRERSGSRWIWDAVSCIGWPILFLMPDRAGWIAFPFLILCLYVSAWKGLIFRRLLGAPVIAAIGGMCYTIYLLHYELIPLVLNAGWDIALSGRVLLYVLVLACAATAFFLLIERPCMERDWPRRLVRRLRRSPPSPDMRLPVEE